MSTTFRSAIRVIAVSAFMIVALVGCGGDSAQVDAPTVVATKQAVAPTAPPATPAQSMNQSPLDIVEAATPVPPRPSIDGVLYFDIASNDHTEAPVSYEQSPPAGGPHWPQWQNCGFYDEAVPNERAVHSLEHGAVWITYTDELSASDRKAIRALADANPYVLVTPYQRQDQVIVATAWGAQLPLEAASDERLADFVSFYAGNGPEPGAPCSGSSDVSGT